MEDARAGAAVVVADVWGEDLLDPALLWAMTVRWERRHPRAPRARSRLGFVLGFVGLEDGLHLHSTSSACCPATDRVGIGYALKLAQRAACLDQGIDEVRWTFDPLVARNGRFNLVRLGAVATRIPPVVLRRHARRGESRRRSDRFEVRWR
jgi:predicted GNAT superfamily acetyltransferase